MSTSKILTAADRIAQVLALNGCKRAFGIPGGEVLAIMDALDRVGIEFVLTKHENAAGFMAEGAWHADGYPPVLIATIGPGVANAVNALANAMQDKVPLVFITGCVDDTEAESYTHQVFDHQKMLSPIVKASYKPTTATAGLAAQKALSIALEPQYGPVHLDIPVSVAESESREPAFDKPLSFPVLAPTGNGPILEAAKILDAAKNPVAIAGVDAVNENAGAEIEAFCIKHQIPLLTTYKGKGLISENHELALGGAGLSPKADTRIMPYLKDTDAVLLIGYDPIEMRIGWRNPWPSDHPVVEITPIARTHGVHSTSHEIRSSIKPALEQLGERMSGDQKSVPPKAKQLKSQLGADFTADSQFGPDRVFSVLRECLPTETVATADSGAHRILLSQMWSCPFPRALLQSSALCTMACAVPLAAGFKLASPETPVIAFVGDAGLEMGLGELASLREHKIPIMICVLVDESLTLIEMKQRASQRPNLGVDFSGSDFPAAAQALGGYGVWIDDIASLKKEAGDALARNTFTVLACRIGRKSYDGKF